MEVEMTLEDFVDESIRVSREHNYHPTTFIGMWQKDRSPAPIKRLVESSEPKSGYKRLVALGLKDWSLEAAVVKFPDRFSKDTLAYAEARLKGILDA
jgi:hypothetical protein